MTLNQKSLNALENLKNHTLSEDKFQASKRSAVLVALLPNSDGELEVILTVRSSSLRTNAGDVAFPGGTPSGTTEGDECKCDPEDIDLIATAKREALEEILLAPSATQTLTLLEPALSRHMQVVTPVVVYCPEMTTADLSSLYPNPGEVSAIFTSPLENFLSPRPREHSWFDMSWLHSNHRVHRFDGCGTTNHVIGQDVEKAEAEKNVFIEDRSKVGWPVYGLTAGLLIEVAKIAYQREPDFQLYAPEQIVSGDLVAEWYNSRHGLRSTL
ncbi:hypothetical protein BGX27_005505 [Mortierella sp. AM989]|nr:hypothetical protein BGX27_005505 [Mortierella sp. AM989]